MTDEEYKLFKRYLKERGLYNHFLEEAKNFPFRRTYQGIIYSINEYISKYTLPTEAIMDLIAWADSKMGSNFWSHEYDKYYKFFVSFNKKKNYEIFESIKKIFI
jgi:hypothetical protein